MRELGGGRGGQGHRRLSLPGPWMRGSRKGVPTGHGTPFSLSIHPSLHFNSLKMRGPPDGENALKTTHAARRAPMTAFTLPVPSARFGRHGKIWPRSAQRAEGSATPLPPAKRAARPRMTRAECAASRRAAPASSPRTSYFLRL